MLFGDSERTFHHGLGRLLNLAAAATLWCISSANAAVINWTGTAGDWSTGANWSTGVEPTYNDDVNINNGGTATIDENGEVWRTLYLGNASANSGNIEMTGGVISAGQEYIGYSGIGVFTQSGGSHTLWSGAYLNLGYNVGSQGTYLLSGTASLSCSSTEFIGYSGKGTFTQTGGTNTTTGYIVLGKTGGGDGTYDMSGASVVNSLALNVGSSGKGTFLQSSGTNTTGTLQIGCVSGAKGTYELSGTGQLSATEEYIGYAENATATFRQSGGSNTTSYMSIGTKGMYYLTGGTLQVNGTFINPGYLDFSGSAAALKCSTGIIDFTQASGAPKNSQAATLNVAANTLLMVPAGYNPSTSFASYSNQGILYQVGTPLTIPAHQTINGRGKINLNDRLICQGSLTMAELWTSEHADFTCKGGLSISAAGYADLGEGKIYIDDSNSGMSGNSFLSGDMFVGYSGTGVFNHSAGGNYKSRNTAFRSIYVGYNAGSNGTYNLSNTGDILNDGEEEFVGYSGTGVFNQTGSSRNDNRGSLYMGYHASGDGTYYLKDSAVLVILFTEMLGTHGKATFVQTGGENHCSDINIAYNADSVGSYTISGGTLAMSGGIGVGMHGKGTFTQSGGSVTASSVAVGVYSDSDANYYLSGGQLKCYSSQVIDWGTFTHTGGTNTITNETTPSGRGLIIGGNFNTNGTYKLSGSGILSAVNEILGSSGNGHFLQTGGAHTVTGTMCLGEYSGSSGTYDFNGGTLILKSLTQGQGTANFNFGGGTLRPSAAFTTAMPMNFSGNGGNATIDTAGYNVSLSGILSGTGGLNKSGTGILTLSGVNTYEGPTTIIGGTLKLDSTGTLGASRLIDVRSSKQLDVSQKTGGLVLGGSQTLTGAGRVVGSVVAMPGSHISPGNGNGRITFTGGLTLNDGALFDYELGSIASSDQIYMPSASLTLHGQEFGDFSFTPLAGFNEGTYVLIDAGTLNGSLGSMVSGSIGNYWGTLSISGNNLVLQVVPEPGTLTLLAAAALLCMGQMKRYRRLKTTYVTAFKSVSRKLNLTWMIPRTAD